MFWVIYMRYLMRSIRCLAFSHCAAGGRGRLSAPVAQQAKSNWVYPGPDGKLVYKTIAAGDKIMDFSHAGYMGGGVALPTVAVKRPSSRLAATTRPKSRRPLTRSPHALEGWLPRRCACWRPGVYPCSGTIKIAGQRCRAPRQRQLGDRTRVTIKLVGKPHTGITVGGGKARPAWSLSRLPAQSIADAYVPSGATEFHRGRRQGLRGGRHASPSARRVTADWVKFMQMDDLVRDGKKQTWLAVGRVAQHRAADQRPSTGNKITLDVPVSDSFDANASRPAGNARSSRLGRPGSRRSASSTCTSNAPCRRSSTPSRISRPCTSPARTAGCAT